MPPGTISANTSWKCWFTRVNVERMAEAFCSSILCRASLMQASPASISAFRLCRSASCSAKFSYCSTALRFTCWKAWSWRLMSARSRTSCGLGSCWQRLTSAAGAVMRWSWPSTSALCSAWAVISALSWSTRTLSCPTCSCRRCSSAACSSAALRVSVEASASACTCAAAAFAPSVASRCSRSSREHACASSSARSSAFSREPRAASSSSSCKRLRRKDSTCASRSSSEARSSWPSRRVASCFAARSSISEPSARSAFSSAGVSPLSEVDALSARLASMDASHSPTRTLMRCFHSPRSAASRAPRAPAASRPWTCSVRRSMSARTPSRRSWCSRRATWRASSCWVASERLSSMPGSFCSASCARWCAEAIDSARVRRTSRCGSW
mmetsp:Transcript_108623/g.338681  ORF Transcript_108623/g.338681 Transcript_108623/m.338681 type:complete len:384 (-) Transcript_108623:1355-2506(-)